MWDTYVFVLFLWGEGYTGFLTFCSLYILFILSIYLIIRYLLKGYNIYSLLFLPFQLKIFLKYMSNTNTNIVDNNNNIGKKIKNKNK